jgi:hypothetical protein
MGSPQKIIVVSAKFSDEIGKIFLLEESLGRFTFDYTFRVKVPDYYLITSLFNMETHKMMLLIKEGQFGMMTCYIMDFSIRDDKPLISSRVLLLQDEFVDAIADEFKDRYASYLIDKTINS